MRTRRRIAFSVLVSYALLLALCGLGCASGSSASQETGASSGSPDYTLAGNSNWADKYPLQFDSYMSGLEDADFDDASKSYVSRSHAAISESIVDSYHDFYPARCMSCHASFSFQEIYADLGDDALTAKWSEIAASYPNVEFFSCLQCHEGSPEGPLTVTNSWWEQAARSYTFTQEETACGQCHNIAGGFSNGDYSRYDFYKYGLDVDSLYQAVSETALSGDSIDGDIDEATGMVLLGEGSYSDVEVFQNSVHQSLGMTCVDCHMPQVTSSDGHQYTWHDSSLSPLENEASLEYCLTCHSGQGIETADDMVDYVRGKQDDVAQVQTAFAESLDDLYDAIRDAQQAGIDDETIQQACDAYQTAYFYQQYIRCYSSAPGMKAAHDYDEMISVNVRGRGIADDAIDLLNTATADLSGSQATAEPAEEDE